MLKHKNMKLLTHLTPKSALGDADTHTNHDQTEKYKPCIIFQQHLILYADATTAVKSRTSFSLSTVTDRNEI